MSIKQGITPQKLTEAIKFLAKNSLETEEERERQAFLAWFNFMKQFPYNLTHKK